MTEVQQLQSVGWGKTNPLLHLVTAVRVDELGLPVVEEEYGNGECLFGWVLSRETNEAMNVWTKRFQEWYERDSGDQLIDHEIEPAFRAFEDAAAAVSTRYEGDDLSGVGEKEAILYRIHQLRGIARVVRDLYQDKAEQLAETISKASACENEEHKGQYHQHIEELTREVLDDLKQYCTC